MPRSKLDDISERRAQATMMMMRKLNGFTNIEVAKEFRCSVQTVESRTALAKREHLLDNAVDKILTDLLTASMKVYAESMAQQEDRKIALEAARDIAFGTGVLSKHNKPAVNPNETTDFTLRAWRDKRLASRAATADGEPSTLEGEVTEAGFLEPPVVYPQANGEGDLSHPGGPELEGQPQPPDSLEVDEEV